MIAIIETGGKQYLVAPGSQLRVEKLSVKPGGAVQFDRVLLVATDRDYQLGRPYINGVVVEGKVLAHKRSKKTIVFKYKAKSRYRRKLGHRQHYTIVEIVKI